MKKFIVSILALLATFVMNVLGDEGTWEYVSLTDKPIFQPTQSKGFARTIERGKLI